MSSSSPTPHPLLVALDSEYKQKRAALIAANYEAIVGEIHHFFQEKILHKVATTLVKEIVKFDYMTNLKRDGDKHLWIGFIGEDEMFYRFKIVSCRDKGMYIIFQDKQYFFDTIDFSPDIFEEFSNLCLSQFRRGYEKPKA